MSTLPIIKQVIVSAPDSMLESDFEKKLYIARVQSEKILADDESFYIPSLSSRVISYKGLIVSGHIRDFYLDLSDRNMKTSMCFSSKIFH